MGTCSHAHMLTCEHVAMWTSKAPTGAFRLCASKRTEAPLGAVNSRPWPAPCRAWL